MTRRLRILLALLALSWVVVMVVVYFELDIPRRQLPSFIMGLLLLLAAALTLLGPRSWGLDEKVRGFTTKSGGAQRLNKWVLVRLGLVLMALLSAVFTRPSPPVWPHSGAWLLGVFLFSVSAVLLPVSLGVSPPSGTRWSRPSWRSNSAWSRERVRGLGSELL